MTKGDANMDDEQSPSGDRDSDSDVTVLPADGSHEGKSPVRELPEGAKVVASLDLARQLDPDVSWVCIGFDRKQSAVRMFIPENDWPNLMELVGFVDMYIRPEFVKQQISGGDNGK